VARKTPVYGRKSATARQRSQVSIRDEALAETSENPSVALYFGRLIRAN